MVHNTGVISRNRVMVRSLMPFPQTVPDIIFKGHNGSGLSACLAKRPPPVISNRSSAKYIQYGNFAQDYFGSNAFGQKITTSRRTFVVRLLERRNAQLCICREFYNFLTSDLHMTIASAELFDGDDFTADMVISIGGDGTFLKAASRVGKKNIPILGINTGRLGFLADISPEEMEETFDEIYNNHYKVEERSVLQLHCDDKKLTPLLITNICTAENIPVNFPSPIYFLICQNPSI